MDKLSIYELFSYLIPGYVTVFLSNHFFSFTKTINDAGMNFGVFVLIASMISGVIIHALIDTLKSRKWFENLVFKHPHEIYAADQYLTPKMKNFLLEIYTKTSNESAIEIINGYPKNLFDHAYHYLESKEKSGPVKNLHSLYYLMRNLAFIFIIFMAIGIFFLISKSPIDNEKLILLILIFGSFGCLFGARFLREKYIGKAIKLYFSYCIHKLHEPK